MSWLDEAENLLEHEAEMQERIADATKWEPKKGDILKGTLIEAKYVITAYGGTYLINVVDTDDATWTVWCGSKLLKDSLMSKHPAVGKGVAIKYNGKKKGKEHEYHDYTFECEQAESPEDARLRAEFWRGLSREEVSEVFEHTPTASEEKGLTDPF